MEHICNNITLRGTLLELPRFSHENHGREFYRFTLEVPRLSGAVDLLPVVAEKSLVDAIDPCAGSMLTVCGQIRSHNQRTDGARRLLIFVFAASIVAEDGEVSDMKETALAWADFVAAHIPEDQGRSSAL